MKDTPDNREMADETQERIIVGFDLHSEIAQLYVSKWRYGREVEGKDIVSTLKDDKIYADYRKLIKKESVTIIEATTNAFSVAHKLMGMGYEVKIVKADTVSRFERPDHVNDKLDARNLAYAEGIHRAQKVYLPSKKLMAYRTLFLKYKSTLKEMTRLSNVIWNFCHSLNCKLPPRNAALKIESVENIIENLAKEPVLRVLIKDCLDDYKRIKERRERIRKSICEIIVREPMMLKAMQIFGIGELVAFTVVAYIGDIHRFKDPSSLVAYLGFNPVCNESGKSKSPKRLSCYGVRHLKSMIVEGMHLAMRYDTSPMYKWAEKKIKDGKPHNVVVCAIARKSIVALWHALMGHPVPNRDLEKHYVYKLKDLGYHAGKEILKEMNYSSVVDFARSVAKPVYAQLPESENA